MFNRPNMFSWHKPGIIIEILKRYISITRLFCECENWQTDFLLKSQHFREYLLLVVRVPYFNCEQLFC